MNAVPELSGVDLARQALLAAREAAKKKGAQTTKPKRRTGTAVRRDGREPLGLGAAISMMMTERGLVAPAAGGSVLAQWETILAAAAPELTGHVQAVKLDADTGRLDVVPDAPAYATKTRWCASKLIEAANRAASGVNVRAVNVLAPSTRAAATTTSPAAADDPAPQPIAPAGPVKTRENASAGYRRALAAHRAVAPPRQEDPAMAAAVVRKEQVRCDLAENAVPGIDQENEAPASPAEVRVQERLETEEIRAAAVMRARVERAGRSVPLVAPALRQAG
ncbi:DUF721 domain-containing protein [Streptomyces sp. NPDC085479]|uniref:DUF721 domain-containing protein n=1 Tax=Streptomyces sp. NPDC085479 TaxID=3365726 RepID=UPI0037D74665